MVLQVIWGIKILASATASAAALSSLSMRPKSRKSDEKAGGRWRKSWWLVCFFCCGAAKNPTKNTWGEKFTVGKLFIFKVFRVSFEESTFHLLLFDVSHAISKNEHQPSTQHQPNPAWIALPGARPPPTRKSSRKRWPSVEKSSQSVFLLQRFHWFFSLQKKLVHLLNVFFVWRPKPTYPPALY